MIHHGDALAVLRTLPDASVQCCVTSPPYYGLRDYGVDGQIGMEKTPEEFIARLVDVFSEVRRVLKPDGTLWVNIGDSYNAYNGNRGASKSFQSATEGAMPRLPSGAGLTVRTLKNKDLIGIPWMLAFALRAEGWWLRQDIIWHKPNPMPESVQDRCTKAHEYVFLFSKSQRYKWNTEAMKEAAYDTGRENGREGRDEDGRARPPGSRPRTLARLDYSQLGRNRRSVWTLATMPTPEAHFATFPLELPELCIKASTCSGDTVLDPFAGAGTTWLACLKHGREFVGIELNPEYIGIAENRARKHYPLMVGAI